MSQQKNICKTCGQPCMKAGVRKMYAIPTKRQLLLGSKRFKTNAEMAEFFKISPWTLNAWLKAAGLKSVEKQALEDYGRRIR